MPFPVEVTAEFEGWWNTLSEEERISIDGMIHVLEAHGPGLEPPYSTAIAGARHGDLRQLRVPHGERIICVLYINDRVRQTLVLLTGSTAGSAEEVCPPDQITLADGIYGTYLRRRDQSD